MQKENIKKKGRKSKKINTKYLGKKEHELKNRKLDMM